tara:strand:- start:510 stop:824 length:315 start_codon:yes stop_codon:yes gene_type:complete
MLKVYNEITAPNTAGTSLSGYINATYQELIDALGEPTFNEESGEDKTQVEWIVCLGTFGDKNVFTIYDWKTYSRDYTENKLDRFNVGGKGYAGEVISHIESLIN